MLPRTPVTGGGFEADLVSQKASARFIVAPSLLSARPTNPALTNVAELLGRVHPDLLVVSRLPSHTASAGPGDTMHQAELEIVRRLRSGYRGTTLVCTAPDAVREDPGNVANLAAAEVATYRGAKHLSSEWIITWITACPSSAYTGGVAIAAARRAMKSVICLGSTGSGVIGETIYGTHASTTLWGVEIGVGSDHSLGPRDGSLLVVDHTRSPNPEIVDIDRHGSFVYCGRKFETR